MRIIQKQDMRAYDEQIQRLSCLNTYHAQKQLLVERAEVDDDSDGGEIDQGNVKNFMNMDKELN